VTRTTRWNQTIAGVERLIEAARRRPQGIEIIRRFFSLRLYSKQ